MKKIELTSEEIEIIERDLRDEIPAFGATPREVEVISKFLKDAKDACEEEDAYDQIDESLEEWYFNKFKAQGIE